MAASRSSRKVKRSPFASSMVGRKKGPARRASIASIRAGAASLVTSRIFASRIERAFVGLVVLGYVLLSAKAHGDAGKSAERLPELPAIPSLEVPRPTPESLADLDERLTKLCSADDAEREAARREVLEVDAKDVPAIRFRLASGS